MWSDIIHEFGDSPSQSRVVRFLLENGFGVTEDGRICCNGIEMPATAIAKAIGSDRRVIDATAQTDPRAPVSPGYLSQYAGNTGFSRVAESLGFAVITVLPKNANERGIVGAAVHVLSDHHVRSARSLSPTPSFPRNPDW